MHDEVNKLFEEGVYFYEQEKFDEAESKFIEALKYNPNSDEIKYNLALVYLEKKEYFKTNQIIAHIKEIDCDEIINELEKVDFDFEQNNPDKISFETADYKFLNKQIAFYVESLNENYLPKNLDCEVCNENIELSELERQNKHYHCPNCNNEVNVKEKERELESTFREKADAELFEILIESTSFKMAFLLAAKKEITRRNINLSENEEFKTFLKKYL